MLLDRYRLPLYAPEAEAGSDDAGSGGGAPPPAGGDGEAGGRDPGGHRRSVREELERGFEQARTSGGGEREDRGDGRDAQGRLLPGHTVRGGRRTKEGEGDGAQAVEAKTGSEAGTEAIADKTGTEAGVDAAAGKEAAGEKIAAEPPVAWSKEAKAEWAKLPPAVQAAAIKREADVQKGVDELKAKYIPLDQALAPHMDAIRSFNKTPAEAISQLFAWFAALGANPKIAFPALAQSFKFDLASLAPPSPSPVAVGAGEAKPAGNAAEGQQPAGSITPEVQQFINGLKAEIDGLKGMVGQEIGGLRSTVAEQQAAWQAQNEAKTNDVLMQWAKDKPHFERVRTKMAQLIGSGYIPLLGDGRVDLDGAYDAALWADKDIRAELTAAQAAAAEKALRDKAEAEKKAQQAAADKARRAAVSVVGAGPGAHTPVNGAGKKGARGKSVKESIAEAIAEVQS